MKDPLCYLIYILIACTILTTSCIKDNFDFDKWDREVDYNSSFAFPLIWGDLAFDEILEISDTTGYIIANSDGYMSLVYKTHVSSNNVQQIINFPEQSMSGNIPNISFDFSNFNNPGDIISMDQTFYMGFTMFNEDAMIDSIIAKLGILNMSVTSTLRHNADIIITFPSVTKNGLPVELPFYFTPQGGIRNEAKELAGYKFDMTRTPRGYNEIPVNINIRLSHSGNTNDGEISFDLNIAGVNYSRIHGYFGSNTLLLESDTIDIPLFRNESYSIERYRFEDPKLSIHYKNSYGIPSQFFFSSLVANSAIDGQDYNIISPGSPMDEDHPVNISYPRIYGEIARDSIKISKENSNIVDIVSRKPQWVSFSAEARTNPLGDANRNNFISENSVLDAELIMEFPLWGYIYKFKSQDTVSVDIPDFFNKYEAVKKLILRVNIQNGFPVEMIAQVYFTDENYNILDSILNESTQQILPAAEVDSDGKVTGYSNKITMIECDKDKFDKISNAKYVIYKTWASTTNADMERVIKLYRDYRARFNIGFEVDLEIKGNIDSISNSF